MYLSQSRWPGSQITMTPEGPGLQCAPEVHRPRDNWQKCQCFISNLSLSLSCKLDSEVDKFKKFLPPSPHGNRCQRLGSCNSSLAGLSLLCCHTTYDLQVSVTDRRCRFQVDRITGIISAAVPTPRQNTSVTVTVIATNLFAITLARRIWKDSV